MTRAVPSARAFLKLALFTILKVMLFKTDSSSLKLASCKTSNLLRQLMTFSLANTMDFQTRCSPLYIHKSYYIDQVI